MRTPKTKMVGTGAVDRCQRCRKPGYGARKIQHVRTKKGLTLCIYDYVNHYDQNTGAKTWCYIGRVN